MYCLELPENLQRLYNVFPVSLLELFHQRGGDDNTYMPMPELEDEEEWEVEEVRGRRKKKNEV